MLNSRVCLIFAFFLCWPLKSENVLIFLFSSILRNTKTRENNTNTKKKKWLALQKLRNPTNIYVLKLKVNVHISLWIILFSSNYILHVYYICFSSSYLVGFLMVVQLHGSPVSTLHFLCTIGHIHKTVFAGTLGKFYETSDTWFHLLFPSQFTQDCSWLKNNILCLKFVSLIFRYSEKQNNRPESPYSFPRKFFATVMG